MILVSFIVGSASLLYLFVWTWMYRKGWVDDGFTLDWWSFILIWGVLFIALVS